MVGQRGIMTANRKTGMVVYRAAAFTDKGVNIFACFRGPLFSRYTKAQCFTPSLFRGIAVGQNFSFLHFLNWSNLPSLLGLNGFLIGQYYFSSNCVSFIILGASNDAPQHLQLKVIHFVSWLYPVPQKKQKRIISFVTGPPHRIVYRVPQQQEID